MAEEYADKPGLTLVGKLFVVLFIGAALYGAYYLLMRGSDGGGGGGSTASRAADPASGASVNPSADSTVKAHLPAGHTVKIGIAYGTEKKNWLKWALDEFRKTEAGRQIHIDLIPLGSLEAAQKILAKDESIHVWAPASSLYKDFFLREWDVQHGGNPIAREEVLAITPMVFVFWEERLAAFREKFGEVSFATIRQALGEKSGWNGIARKPEWGLFKFGHTHPNKSNSGLAVLVLMAYEFHGKTGGLEMKDILDTAFQTSMQDLERAANTQNESTGTLMVNMVRYGPSTFDAVCVYESVVIENLKNAEGRWGGLQVVYPKQNLWNENPYCILGTPWTSDAQRAAATAFLEFLLSEPIQKESLTHGFRPGNPRVPIKFDGSPFIQYQSAGLRIDLTTVCEPPKSEVIHNLLVSWQRSQGSR